MNHKVNDNNQKQALLQHIYLRKRCRTIGL